MWENYQLVLKLQIKTCKPRVSFNTPNRWYEIRCKMTATERNTNQSDKMNFTGLLFSSPLKNLGCMYTSLGKLLSILFA